MLDGMLAAREWLDWLRDAKGRSENTLIAYRRVVRSFLAVTPDLERATPEHIERWLRRPRAGRAMGEVATPATQNRDASCVRSFYSYLLARGYIQNDPSVLVCTPTIRNVQPKPLSDDVWQKMWQVANDGGAIALGLGYFCGLRREELVSLRVSHIDLFGRRIVNFIRKGGGEDTVPAGTMLDVFSTKLPHLGSERLWPLVAAACEDRRGDQWLFNWSDLGRRTPGALEPRHINAWLDRFTREECLPPVHPHRLRHSCATNLLRAGVPLPLAASLLNHRNVQTTLRYMKASGSELSEWLNGSVNK